MAFIWLWWVGIVVLASYLLTKVARSDPLSLHGIYAIPGRWYSLKYYTVKLILAFGRRYKLHLGRRMVNKMSMLRSHQHLSQLECSTGVCDDPHGHNSIYVNGSDQTGTIRLIARVAIKSDDRRDVWFLLRLPGFGDLVLPRHPHCVVTDVPRSGFSGGGLSFTVTDPLRTWRISYNGLCRIGIRTEWTKEDNRPQVHLRCSFIWSTFTSYFDFSTDVHPCLTAQSIANETWTKALYDKLKRKTEEYHFEQFGMIHGVVQVDNQEEQEVVMRGVKNRSCGTRRWSDMHSYVLCYIVLEDGTCVHAGSFCFPGSLSSLTSGFVIKANGSVIPAVSVDLPLADLIEATEDPPMRFSFSIQLQTGEKVSIEVQTEDVIHLNMDSDWSVRIREGLSRFMVNGVQGRGVCEILKRFVEGCPLPSVERSPRLYKEPEIISESDANAFVVPLGALSCQASSIAGGKGSQLAKLMSLQKELQSQLEYDVPTGFVITTSAYQRHLERNHLLCDTVKELNEVSCDLRSGNLQDCCKRTVALFTETDIGSDIRQEINNVFRLLFGGSNDNTTYAVRSSSVGEDTQQLSAAGQMDTFLGVKTLVKIFEETRRCWASQFSFRAVQYRRQHGQKIDSEMAVVVQTMIPADSAGVIFSNDPLTGDPTRVVINASYGLGESVVSGVSESDKIILQKDTLNNLRIVDKKIASKQQAIVISDG